MLLYYLILLSGLFKSIFKKVIALYKRLIQEYFTIKKIDSFDQSLV